MSVTELVSDIVRALWTPVSLIILILIIMTLLFYGWVARIRKATQQFRRVTLLTRDSRSVAYRIQPWKDGTWEGSVPSDVGWKLARIVEETPLTELSPGLVYVNENWVPLDTWKSVHGEEDGSTYGPAVQPYADAEIAPHTAEESSDD